MEDSGEKLAEFVKTNKPKMPVVIVVELAFGPVMFEAQRIGVKLLDRPLFRMHPEKYLPLLEALASGQENFNVVVV